MSRRNPRDRGVVLVLVLLVLALAAMLMLTLSRGSAEQAVEARDAAVELQRRWGEASLRSALLPKIDEVLKQVNGRRAEKGDAAVTSVESTITLGEVSFDVTLSDEQAKPNLNSLWRIHGDRLPEVLRQVLPRGFPANIIEPRPDARSTMEVSGGDGGDDPEAVPAFGSWSQIASRASAGQVYGWDAVQGIGDVLTLWGDGRLALRWASREAVTAMTADVLSAAEIRRLLETRDTSSGEGNAVEGWLATLEATDETRAALASRLTGESNCFSIVVAAHDPWRTRYTQGVREVFVDGAGSQEADTERQPPERIIRLVW